jgi:hypothetical protein
MQQEARLGEIVRAHPYLTAALHAARDIAAPDWLVSAGAIRDAVWDALHGRPPVPPRDVDLPLSCVGLRLLANDELLVVAPYGLGDLLGGICRHNPARAPEDVYRRRVEEKRWRERWPRLRFS